MLEEEEIKGKYICNEITMAEGTGMKHKHEYIVERRTVHWKGKWKDVGGKQRKPRRIKKGKEKGENN